MKVSIHLAPQTFGLGVLLMGQSANYPQKHPENRPESISLSPAQRDTCSFQSKSCLSLLSVL